MIVNVDSWAYAKGAARKVMRLWLCVSVLCVSVVLTGCFEWAPGERTKIVAELEDAGGGDARTASQAAIRQWFAAHQDFAQHLAMECVKVKTKDINYADSVEGKVCSATWPYAPMPEAGRDNVAF